MAFVISRLGILYYYNTTHSLCNIKITKSIRFVPSIITFLEVENFEYKLKLCPQTQELPVKRIFFMPSNLNSLLNHVKILLGYRKYPFIIIIKHHD